jgi:hypothetical protein
VFVSPTSPSPLLRCSAAPLHDDDENSSHENRDALCVAMRSLRQSESPTWGRDFRRVENMLMLIGLATHRGNGLRRVSSALI